MGDSFTVTNINDNVTLSETQIGLLGDFLNTVESTNTVSRNAILSLESLMERPVISETVALNSITNHMSSNGVDGVIKVTKGILSKYNTSTMVTELDVERIRRSAKVNVVRVRNLLSNVRINRHDVLSRAYDDKYSLVYHDDILTDIKELYLKDAIKYNYRALETILGITGLSSISDIIYDEDTDIYLLGLISDRTSFIYSDKYTINDITVIGLLQLLTEEDTICYLNDLSGDISRYHISPTRTKRLKIMFKKFTDVSNIFNNELVNKILLTISCNIDNGGVR